MATTEIISSHRKCGHRFIFFFSMKILLH